LSACPRRHRWRRVRRFGPGEIALIVFVRIFAVAETERPAIAVHKIVVPTFGLIGILDDGFARLAFLVITGLKGGIFGLLSFNDIDTSFCAGFAPDSA
jgi:hypothetical protein